MQLQKNKRGFDWRTALTLAECSEMAYHPAAKIRRYLQDAWGVTDFDFIQAGATELFIAKARGSTVIAFRGSKGKSDWLANLKLGGFETSIGIIHTGFYEAFSEVQKVVIDAAKRSSSGRLYLTGHSLGGALASIAAAHLGQAELKNRINSLYTFGQPRIGDSVFGDLVENACADDVFRFVNDDDIVTRLPPGFSHFGHLLRFKENGDLRTKLDVLPENGTFEASGREGRLIPDLADRALNIDPPELNPEEFSRLQSELREVQGWSEGLVSTESVDLTAEGLVPSFSDHRIRHYVSAVRRYARMGNSSAALSRERAKARAFRSPVQFRILSAPNNNTADRIARPQPVPGGGDENSVVSPAESTPTPARPDGAPIQAAPDVPPVSVLIKLSGAGVQIDLPSPAQIFSRVGNILTAEVPIEMFEELESIAGVTDVEISRAGGHLELIDSNPFLRRPVNPPDGDELGDNALIVIIDTGIDILHDAFLDAAGNTRIIGIWDQTNTSTNMSPAKLSPSDFTQNYGRLYTAGEIQNFRKNPGEIPDMILRDRGIRGGHGTHVAGIAAGAACGSLGRGIAPEAKILVVITEIEADLSDPLSIGYSRSHVDALSLAKTVGAGGTPLLSEDLPTVINVSQGMSAGAHDGLTLLETAFSAVTGFGKTPEIAIIKSAGNEGIAGRHASMVPFLGTETIAWRSQSIDRRTDYFEAWVSGTVDLSFAVVTPNNIITDFVSRQNLTLVNDIDGNRIKLDLDPLASDNGAQRLTLQILKRGQPIQPGIWKLEIETKRVGYNSERLDIWAERGARDPVAFILPDASRTLTVPGTSQSVITVSAVGRGAPMRLMDGSSRGMTRDGRPKPDICAPGVGVMSAMSGSNNHQASCSKTGTSMAAPHVAGLVALAFSKARKKGIKLNANQIAALLRQTVQTPGQHHEAFGHGLVDGTAFLDRI